MDMNNKNDPSGQPEVGLDAQLREAADTTRTERLTGKTADTAQPARPEETVFTGEAPDTAQPAQPEDTN